MKFSQYRPRARRFSSRLGGFGGRSRSSHPFLAQSGFNRRRFWIKFLGLFSTVLFFSLVGLMVLTVFAFIVFAKDLPSPYKLTARDSSLSTKIYDRGGKLLYDIYGDKNRALVNWDSLPPYVKESTVAIEDKDFYKHSGFSAFGILRSVFRIVVFRKLEGGSTITQLVVKNTLLSPERTLTRKIKEFILAIQVERKYSKDEILQIYLNEVPYGGTAWGIEAAAQAYFSKEARDLTLTEAVILAGMPQRPSFYSPFGTNPKAYVSRADDVARRMREDGYITRDQEEALKRDIPNVAFSGNDRGIRAPHFVFYVKDLLVERYGEKLVEQGGLKVRTSLDLDLQDKAQNIVFEEIAKLTDLKVGNGSAVVMDVKTGEILAMVGSKDYFAEDYDGQVNVAMSLRQPGSALKPFTYATAFKAGYTPASVLMDVATVFPGGENLPDYKPVNYDGKFRGPVQVRFALGNSINMPAVKMTALVGIKNMLRTAYDAGLKSLEPTDENLKRFGLSVTLGGGEVRLLELTGGYATLASGGTYHAPLSILKVEDRGGKILEEVKDEGDIKGKEVLGSDIAFLISHILADNNARADVFGLGSFLNIAGKTVAVKTGTTDDKRDNWAVGYTPSAVVGVWVGNNDNSAMNPKIASGITGATPIWNRIMREVLAGRPAESFAKPDNVTALEIDSLGGGLPCRDFAKRSEYFIKGTEPSRDCLVEKMLDGKDYFVFTEFDPVSTDGKNRWQEGIDAWALTQDERYRPPKELLGLPGAGDGVSVKIKNLSDHQQVPQSIEVEAEVTSAKKITKVELYIGDAEGNFPGVNDSKTEGSSPYKFNFTFGANGHRKIKVKAYNEAGEDNSAEVEVSV
ncbi:penicillin-binding protein, partial [Candidatus Curtissbacteria bacterium]|nr:penicillin-binding protein [Candidatus Curtissbacteria bacterium]